MRALITVAKGQQQGRGYEIDIVTGRANTIDRIRAPGDVGNVAGLVCHYVIQHGFHNPDGFDVVGAGEVLALIPEHYRSGNGPE